MLEHIYFVAGEFAENRGSYAGFIEEFSRYASKKGGMHLKRAMRLLFYVGK